MKQATHAWIAIRAAALLSDDPDTKGLATLLTPHVRTAALGAWMPDLADTKMGSGDIDNHVFKMEPVKKQPSAVSYQPSALRFITQKAELLASLGPGRAVSAFIGDDDTLDRHWWGSPYRADPLPCQDLPTRASALSTTLIDQLVLGDEAIARKVPRDFALSRELTVDERTRTEQLALYFFMQSHFAADACMPCHCDGRKLSAYQGGLHAEWEEMMERAVPEFGREQIGHKAQGVRHKEDGMMELAREIDSRFGISFPTSIPEPRTSDPWKDTVAVCRASFAVASIVAHPRQFPYASEKTLSLRDVKSDPGEWARFEKATASIMHDAVINVAMGWKRIWGRFGVRGARCEVRKGAER